MYYSQCINSWCIWCTTPMGRRSGITRFTLGGNHVIAPHSLLSSWCSSHNESYISPKINKIKISHQDCLIAGYERRVEASLEAQNERPFRGMLDFSVNRHRWTINVILVQKDILKTVKLSLLGLMAKIKCSICSYRFDSWYVLQCGTSLLNGFLVLGVGLGACSVRSTHRPGIAVPPGTVHPPWGEHSNKEKIIFVI